MLLIALFMNPTELARFANDPGNSVNTIVSITHDTTSGKYVLFYKS